MTRRWDEEQLIEIESLIAKTTPGPWIVWGFKPNGPMNKVCQKPASKKEFDKAKQIFRGQIEAFCPNPEDAAFIAMARDLVPGLIQDLREARKELTRHRNYRSRERARKHKLFIQARDWRKKPKPLTDDQIINGYL